MSSDKTENSNFGNVIHPTDHRAWLTPEYDPLTRPLPLILKLYEPVFFAEKDLSREVSISVPEEAEGAGHAADAGYGPF